MSKPKAFTPTPEQLAAALFAVRYEIRQLALLYPALTLPLDSYLRNAVVETTVIHLNVLAAFFGTPSVERHKDDVLAADYGFPVSTLVERAAIERRNKEIAHLTYTRSARAPQDWGWDFEQLVPPVLKHARQFVAHIRSNATLIAAETERKEWDDVAGSLDRVLCQPISVKSASTTEVSANTFYAMPVAGVRVVTEVADAPGTSGGET